MPGASTTASINFGPSSGIFSWDIPEALFFTPDPVRIFGFLDVITANDAPIFLDRTGNDGELIFFAQDGVIEGSIDVIGNAVTLVGFTGSHMAWMDGTLPMGTLVSMTGDNRYLGDNPEGEILYGVSISQKKNDPAILGAYLSLKDSSSSRHPEADQPGVTKHLIMSVGNGHVWVADMGQDIQPGDYLISSAVAGHAMKDDRSEEVSHIIGRAAEPVVWSEVSDTVGGVKHKKISILFDFVPLNNYIP